MTKHGRQCNWRQEDIDVTVRQFGESIDDGIASEITPIYRLGIHDFWNILKGSSEWKSLADLTLVLMTMPLAEADNQRIFSLKTEIVGIHDTRANTERLHARARIKVHADPK
jgi:hypothetical protein